MGEPLPILDVGVGACINHGTLAEGRAAPAFDARSPREASPPRCSEAELDALRQKNRELEAELAREREKVRLRDEFLANASYELRRPLNSIVNIPEGIVENLELVRYCRCRRCNLSFEQAVEARCPYCGQTGAVTRDDRCFYVGPPDELLRYMELIYAGGQELLRMVGDMNDISALASGELGVRKELVSLHEVLDETTAIVRPLAQRRGVKVERRRCAGDVVIEGDPARLRQILAILLDNAVKFSGQSGVVTADFYDECDDVLLWVKDRGIGIDPREHEAIFESFYQVRDAGGRRTPGTGIGLAIAKRLVELHGGILWVRSKPGQGSTFYVRLPHRGAVRKGGAGASREVV